MAIQFTGTSQSYDFKQIFMTHINTSNLVTGITRTIIQLSTKNINVSDYFNFAVIVTTRMHESVAVMK